MSHSQPSQVSGFLLYPSSVRFLEKEGADAIQIRIFLRTQTEPYLLHRLTSDTQVKSYELNCPHHTSDQALCDPMDSSPSGSFVHGILQATIMEWVAIPFSRGSSRPRDLNLGLLHCRLIPYHLSHQGGNLLTFPSTSQLPPSSPLKGQNLTSRLSLPSASRSMMSKISSWIFSPCIER